MVSKKAFYWILSLFILTILFNIYFHWILHFGTRLLIVFWLLFLSLWFATKKYSDGVVVDADARDVSVFFIVITIASTIFVNVMSFFSIKNACDFNYTTTFKVFTLREDDSDKIKNVCKEEKEKAETVNLVNFVWEIDKIKGCTIPNKKREIIYDIKNLSKEEFDTDFESHKKFLLNVIEDCKSDIIRNNLLKDKTYNSNVDDYLKQINEFKTKIENISNK